MSGRQRIEILLTLKWRPDAGQPLPKSMSRKLRSMARRAMKVTRCFLCLAFASCRLTKVVANGRISDEARIFARRKFYLGYL